MGFLGSMNSAPVIPLVCVNLIQQCLSGAAGWLNTYFHFFHEVSLCLLCSCQREFNRLERVGRGYNHEIGGKQAMFCGAIMEPYQKVA